MHRCSREVTSFPLIQRTHVRFPVGPISWFRFLPGVFLNCQPKCQEIQFTFVLGYRGYLTTCLVQWIARLTAIQEVPGSIPGYILEIFLEVQGLDRDPPSLVRPIGQLLDKRSSEIRLRKLKLRLGDSALLTTRALYCHMAATASVGLGSSELQCHGFNLIFIRLRTRRSLILHIANGRR